MKMKMLLVGSALVGVLVTSGSGAAFTRFDHASSTEAVRPSMTVAHKPRTTQIVDVDYQLSDQERTLLAFMRLKTDAERNGR
jgi:hypothetical protein